MNKEEALKKIEELKQFVESYDRRELKVGDFVRVKANGKVSKIFDVLAPDTYMLTGWDNLNYSSKALQKITPEEYEEEKKLPAEGWIPHVGDECPVDDKNLMLDVRYEGGFVIENREADWHDSEYPDNKHSHYRIVQQKKNPYGLNWNNIDCVGLANVTFYKNCQRLKLRETLNTLLELFSCDGVKEKVDDKGQWLIESNGSGRVILPKSYRFYSSKAIKISPAFDTKENARKAVDKIGRDRLIKMFDVMGGKFDE